jgi:hypothetical protein
MYLAVVISRGDRTFAVHGLDEDELHTLEDVRRAGHSLSFDEKRLAMGAHAARKAEDLGRHGSRELKHEVAQASR